MFMRKLLFFHAPWCPPCRFFEKQFIEPLEELAGSERICRVNVQNEPSMADKYLVDRLPTVIILDGEKVYMRRMGAIDIYEIAGVLYRGDGD